MSLIVFTYQLNLKHSLITMNLLGFLAIVIAVTGLVWLLQMIFKGKDRIDINFSVGRSSIPPQELPIKTNLIWEAPTSTAGSDSDSTFGAQTPRPTAPVAAKPISTTASEPDQTNQDAYLTFIDENFEEHSNDSLLKADDSSQPGPLIGQLTFSGFGNLSAHLPLDSFDKPQSPEQIEAMFAVLRESTRRIEEQMIALYEVHRSMGTKQNTTLSPSPSSPLTNTDDSGDYDFGDDDDLTGSSFGGGLGAQLGQAYPEDESQSAPPSEFLTMGELGISISDDAFQTYDADAVLESVPEIRQEALPYFANLNKTGELSYEVVNAIKRKAPIREVKHRVRQVLRAIDHFNFSSDANAALRVTAAFRQLPMDLGEFDNDVAAIGRRFGLIEPENDPLPVEADEVSTT